jgi:hypothetical protein
LGLGLGLGFRFVTGMLAGWLAERCDMKCLRIEGTLRRIDEVHFGVYVCFGWMDGWMNCTS